MSVDYNQVAREYARHRRVHPGVLRSLIQHGGCGPDSRVLEVGAGTGNYITAIQSLTGCAAWGVDPSEQMLAQAKARGSRVDFRLGRAESLEFEGASFDVVFSVDVIHHVQGHLAYLREAHRVLRPGGKLFTVTDSEWIIRHRVPLSAYFPETIEKELARYPGIDRLAQLMQEVGFRGLQETLEEFAYELGDIGPYREKAFSSLHIITEEAFQRGIARMKADLDNGPIACTARYTVLSGVK